MRAKKLTIVCILMISNIISIKSYAYHVGTHRGINQHIAQKNIGEFSLDQYLKDNLDFEEGSEEKIYQQGEDETVFEWLGYGGEAEDGWPGSEIVGIPQARYLEHFHDPLKGWGSAGLWDLWGVNDSLIDALQKQDRRFGSYSWMEVREYYFDALTKESEDERKEYFAETFRGLGQLMHLIEDTSVPLHTRNDGHFFFYNYENYVEDEVEKLKDGEEPSKFPTWLAEIENCLPNKGILQHNLKLLPANPLRLPILRLVDTDQYFGTDPSVTLESIIGLAEFSNANFLSGGTIPGTISDGNYKYPELSTTETGQYKGAPREYYMHDEIDGTGSYKLAVTPMIDAIYDVTLEVASLDDNVYSDYASRLVPRAAGYSALLLEHFFSGEIDLILGPYGYQIENKSDGAMEGDFYLYYDTEDKERKPIISTNNGGDQWVKNFKINAGEKSEAFYNFISPDDLNKDYKCILVFKGKLSNKSDEIPSEIENEAVIGKVCEILPCTITDEVNIMSGTLNRKLTMRCEYTKPFPEKYNKFINTPGFARIEEATTLYVEEDYYIDDTLHQITLDIIFGERSSHPENRLVINSTGLLERFDAGNSYREKSTNHNDKSINYGFSEVDFGMIRGRCNDIAKYNTWYRGDDETDYHHLWQLRHVDHVWSQWSGSEIEHTYGTIGSLCGMIDDINDLQLNDSYLWRKYYQE